MKCDLCGEVTTVYRFKKDDVTTRHYCAPCYGRIVSSLAAARRERMAKQKSLMMKAQTHREVFIISQVAGRAQEKRNSKIKLTRALGVSHKKKKGRG